MLYYRQTADNIIENNLMHIDHISISRESCYTECHQKYKYRYHLKVPAEEEKEYFTYGKLVHKTIEEYTRGRGLVPIKTIVEKIYEEGIEGKKINLSLEYKRQYPRDINQFLTLTKKIGTDGEVEMPFKKSLDGGDKCVVGVIDRIIQKDDKFYIIDYKTTKDSFWRKNDKSIVNDLQLQCYAWTLMDLFSIPADRIFTSLYYLQGGNCVGAQFTEKTLSQTPIRLLEVYNSIENQDPDTVIGNVSSACKRCDYCKICPFWAIAEKMKLY